MPRKYNHSGTQKYQAAAFSWTYRTVFADSVKDLGLPMVVPIAVIRLVLWMSASTVPLNLSADRRGTSA